LLLYFTFILGAQNLTLYPVPYVPGDSGPSGITAGPDGALWFTYENPPKIGRITTSGVLTLFPLSSPDQRLPGGITTGPDGALWFTEYNWVYGAPTGKGKIGRITTGGEITEFPVSTPPRMGITAGADGALWFTTSKGVTRITTTGSVIE
jgi:virginiamycin B lyase